MQRQHCPGLVGGRGYPAAKSPQAACRKQVLRCGLVLPENKYALTHSRLVKNDFLVLIGRMPLTVGLISLGCAKNLIDSEIMAGNLQQAGMLMTDKTDIADVVIINTCSFIDKAKQESIDAILGVAEARKSGAASKKQKLIVAGCLSQRFSKELPNLMPEVDAFIGLDQIAKVDSVIAGLINKSAPKSFVTAKPRYIPEYDTPRYRLTPRHSAYVKIAEGCNHHCTFCIIPKIRGVHRSRTQASVVREVRELVKSGVKEINLISQDTTYFGMDLWQGERPNKTSLVDSSKGDSLASLLRELDSIEGDFWIRVLYTHPAHWSDELIETFGNSSKIARYVDMPLQHISDPMLKAMRRETNGAYIRDLIARMRAGIPGLGLRTTFIVGFPGESMEDFDELIEFCHESKFERAGVFNYSDEEGTTAHRLPDHLDEKVRTQRWNQAMQQLQQITIEANQSRIGQTIKVLVDSPGVARSDWDAPDIDTQVLVPEDLPVGEFAMVTVVDMEGYDLIAR